MATALDSNPKIRKSGRLGREVFLFALRRYGERYAKTRVDNGRFPAVDLEPWYVADQLMMSEAEAMEGVTKCITAKLIVLDGDEIEIDGYTEDWKAESTTRTKTAERQARWREREKAKSDALRNGADNSVTGDITLRDARNAVDKIRSDKTRSENKEGPTEPSSADSSSSIAARGHETEPRRALSLVPEATESSVPKPKRSERPPAPIEALTAANLLLAFVIGNHPGSRVARMTERVQEATAERWADTIDKMQRIDGHTWGEIEGMILWCQKHSFWRTVILGADNLRDKWDKMLAQRNPRAPQQRTNAYDVLDAAAAEMTAQEQKK